MNTFASDIAFTPAVKAIQEEMGSRDAYAKQESGRGWRTEVDDQLRQFLAQLDMFYLGTANVEGQPYIQYRGGSPGFLKVIDQQTLGFADFAGIAKGFGLDGHTVTDVAQIPDLVEAFKRSDRGAVWDMRVSDKVVSRITRQAHPQRK